jgi:hypothetical protein
MPARHPQAPARSPGSVLASRSGGRDSGVPALTSGIPPEGNGQAPGVEVFPAPAKGEIRVGVMAGGAPKDAERYVRFRGFRLPEIAKEE